MHLYRHFWRMMAKNKIGLIIYGAITLVMIIGIASTAKSSYQDNDMSGSYRISYSDLDDSVLSRGLVEYLAKNNQVTDLTDKSDESISSMVYFTMSHIHFYIPKDYEAQIEAGKDVSIEYLATASGASYTNSLKNMVQTYVNSFLSYEKMGFDAQKAVEKTTASMQTPLAVSTLQKEHKSKGDMVEWGIYQIILFMTYVSFGMICLTAGQVMVHSDEPNVRKRIASSPVSEVKTTICNTIGIYSMGLVCWAIFTLGMFVIGHNTGLVAERGFWMSFGLLLAILSNCSITVLIASFAPKSNTMSMVVNIIGLSMSFLCGVFVPQWLLGNGVLKVARFMPAYWSTYAYNMIYTQSGAGLDFDRLEIIKCFGIELLFAVAFIALAIVIRRAKLQRA